MSFQLLQSEIIDTGLCKGCGVCAKACKHIEIEEKIPLLLDFCIMERNGQNCGQCYAKCPVVLLKKRKKKLSLEFASQQTNPETIDYTLSKKERLNALHIAYSPRERMLQWITENGGVTIPKLAEELDLPSSKVRYALLRLVQQKQLHMESQPRFPIFTLVI